MSRTKHLITLGLGILIGYQLGNSLNSRVWVNHHPRWGMAVAFLVMGCTLGFLVHSIREMRRWDAKLKEEKAKFVSWVNSLPDAQRHAIFNAASVPEPSITCPICNYTSYNKNDIFHGWCGKCERQTSQGERIDSFR